jgi:hypothetical protein
MGWDGTRSAVELREGKGREGKGRDGKWEIAVLMLIGRVFVAHQHVAYFRCTCHWCSAVRCDLSVYRNGRMSLRRVQRERRILHGMEPPHLGVVPLHQILLHQHGEPHVPLRARARARPNACMRAYVRRGAVASTGRLVPERTHAHRRRTKHDAVCYVRVLS